MSKLMKSVSGIRGIVGDSLTTELVLSFAKRFGIFSGRGKVVVGRDSRTTGKMFLSTVSAGLMSVGANVIDLGICPTPTVLLAVENLKADGGIAITASHNPPEWNALKLINGEGTFLTPVQAKISGTFLKMSWRILVGLTSVHSLSMLSRLKITLMRS